MSTPLPHIRPGSRERLVTCGVDALSDPELLALFIGTGRAGRNCLQVSADLLRSAGSLRDLLLMHPPAIRQLPGLGPARYARLQSALELARRARLAIDASTACGTAKVRGYLVAAVTNLPGQAFAAAFLGPEGQCLGCELMFRGTLQFVHVHPREIVRRALSLHAVAVSVARGDPEGEPLSAPPDHALCKQLSTALGLVGVRLRDYYVVGQSCECVLLSAREELTSAPDGFPAQAAAAQPWPAHPHAAHSRGPRLPQQLALDLSYPSAERMPEDWPTPRRPEPKGARSRGDGARASQPSLWPFLQ